MRRFWQSASNLHCVGKIGSLTRLPSTRVGVHTLLLALRVDEEAHGPSERLVHRLGMCREPSYERNSDGLEIPQLAHANLVQLVG